MVPVGASERLYVRLRRAHHVFGRSVRPSALQDAARRQRALAGPRSVDLQQERVYALSVPGGALWTARGCDQRVHCRGDRGALRLVEAGAKGKWAEQWAYKRARKWTCEWARERAWACQWAGERILRHGSERLLRGWHSGGFRAIGAKAAGQPRHQRAAQL